MRLLALVFGVLTVTATTACGHGGSSSEWRTLRTDCVSIRYPPGWHATKQPLTPVSDPPQVLAVASYPLPRDSSGANGCQPKEALERLPLTGAFIFGWEYANPKRPGLRERDFPPRSKRFTLTGFAQYECAGPGCMARFRDAGRLFQIHIAFGRQASAATRRTALRVLDSFRVERS